jgi:CBS domain-containing protein
MSRDVKTIGADLPLRDAARHLTRLGVRGVPVVDDTGRCVGILSVSDLARWAAGQGEPGASLAKGCAFQEKYREAENREAVVCLLSAGVCPFQRSRTMPDGRAAVVCSDPHCVPTDWQVVEVDHAPVVVRDVMTNDVVSASPTAPVAELARAMLDRGVHRVIVLDSPGRPVGVVSVNDLLQVLAQLELATSVVQP